MNKVEVDEQYFIEVCRHADNMSDACRKLGYHPSTFQTIAKRLGCYLPNRTNRPKYIPWHLSAEDIKEKYLSNAHPIHSADLRKKLIRTGLKKPICEICGLSEWQGKPIPLELHHIDGNRYNNHLDNLQVICPTCHSQITNGSNVSKAAKPDNRANQAAQRKKKANRKPRVELICPVCGQRYSSIASRASARKYCSYECKAIGQHRFNASAEELLDTFKKLPNYTKVAQQFGVSDNAVKKRCKRLGIYEEIDTLIKAEKVARGKRLSNNLVH